MCNSRLIQLESEHRRNNIIIDNNSFAAFFLLNPIHDKEKIDNIGLFTPEFL